MTQADPTHDERIERLIDEHGGQLYALASRLCGDREEARDLVQEVFLQASRKLDTFEGRSSLRTWLYTIAARACQRMHRKRAGEPAHIGSLDALLPFGDPLIAAIPSEQEGVVEAQIRREAREAIERAIAELPDEFRLPVVLKEIVGLTVPEVASIMGLEEGTVKSRIHRARLRLRAAVDGVIPRQKNEAPPPAYSKQVCLDLLDAKQEALDRGAPFDAQVICERCRSVFASLDLARDACRDLAGGQLPAEVRARVAASIASDRGAAGS